MPRPEPIKGTRPGTAGAGFTLIELMIVVVIIAVLGAIAYPSYTSHMEQTRRADGKAALLDAAQRMERCYTQNNTFVGCTVPPISSDGYYEIDFSSAPTASAYELRASPQGVQGSDGCGAFLLHSNGTRGVTGTLAVDRCW